MAKWIDELHGNGQRIVPIIDVGIPFERSDTYARGRELDVYVKDRKGEDYVGKVWPGWTVFPGALGPSLVADRAQTSPRRTHRSSGLRATPISARSSPCARSARTKIADR